MINRDSVLVDYLFINTCVFTEAIALDQLLVASVVFIRIEEIERAEAANTEIRLLSKLLFNIAYPRGRTEPRSE